MITINPDLFIDYLMDQQGDSITIYIGIRSMDTLINASRHSGPPNWTLIQIQKSQTGPRTSGRTDGWTDILYFNSGYLNPWPVAACAARTYGLRTLIAKNRYM